MNQFKRTFLLAAICTICKLAYAENIEEFMAGYVDAFNTADVSALANSFYYESLTITNDSELLIFEDRNSVIEWLNDTMTNIGANEGTFTRTLSSQNCQLSENIWIYKADFERTFSSGDIGYLNVAYVLLETSNGLRITNLITASLIESGLCK